VIWRFGLWMWNRPGIRFGSRYSMDGKTCIDCTMIHALVDSGSGGDAGGRTDHMNQLLSIAGLVYRKCAKGLERLIEGAPIHLTDSSPITSTLNQSKRALGQHELELEDVKPDLLDRGRTIGWSPNSPPVHLFRQIYIYIYISPLLHFYAITTRLLLYS